MVRRAEPRDLETVVELRRALRREERPDAPDADDDLRTMTRRQLHGSSQIILLAATRDRSVGMLRCALQSPADPAVSTALLTTAWVHPAFRRTGVMTRLVADATDWCAAQGVYDVRLRNAYHNAVASAAWEALGFRIVQVIRQRTTER